MKKRTLKKISVTLQNKSPKEAMDRRIIPKPNKGLHDPAQLGMAVRDYNPSATEAEAERLQVTLNYMSSGPARST